MAECCDDGCVFFFKQKTAYEMRISYWSSDVCSSDLEQVLKNDRRILASARDTEVGRRLMDIPGVGPLLASAFVASVADPHMFKIGRASCRESVGQYV